MDAPAASTTPAPERSRLMRGVRGGNRGLRFVEDTDGFLELKGFTKALAVIGIILVSVIMLPLGLNILAGALPSVFGSIGNITGAFKVADVKDPTLNLFLRSMATIVGIALILVPVGLVFLFTKFTNPGKSKSS